MTVRGSKPPKNVWVVRHQIDGTGENYIWNIFASRDTAVSSCRAHVRYREDPKAKESHYDYDGDAYFYYDGGSFIMQRYPVQLGDIG